MLATLITISVCAIWFHLARGYTLYSGDALAHLTVARRMIDSRTPGFDQIGTAWLPLPHLLMLPFAGNDALWSNGLAGVIPAAVSFVMAGAFLYAAVHRIFDCRWTAMTAALLFALNPNILHLQSTPMNEVNLAACLMAMLYATVWYQQTSSTWAVILAGVASNAASLTRYEGWSLIPFLSLFFLLGGKQRRPWMGILFGALAAIGPLAWLAHNWWWYGNPLEFYNGPYSMKAIVERKINDGMARYPGDHNWPLAWLQYRSAAHLCAGPALSVLGLAGIAAAIWRRAFWPVVFLAIPVGFYVLSVYSTSAPIFVPHLWPHSYLNTRYGLGALPLLAVCAAAIVSVVPGALRGIAAALVIFTTTVPWIAYPRPESWICWKESQVNSEGRRAWSREAAEYLKANYRRGEGIYSALGDLSDIYRQAGIPLGEVLQEGNNPHWEAVRQRPDLFLWEQWAVAISGDDVSTTLLKSGRRGPRFVCVKIIAVKGAPVIEIYRRQSDTNENTLHQGPRREE